MQAKKSQGILIRTPETETNMKYKISAILMFAATLAVLVAATTTSVQAPPPTTTETTTCEGPGNSCESQGRAQEQNDNIEETTCKETRNHGGNEVKGKKFSGCTTN